MENCYEGMRAALARNIEGLTHLSVQQREALLESQMSEAVAATEAGKPFVDIYGPEEPTTDMGEDVDESLPVPRAPRAGAGQALKP